MASYQGHVLSNMQNVAFSRCCFVIFCQERQRNEQRTITHAYTTIALVTVVVKKAFSHRTSGQIMNSQASTKQMNAQPNKETAESSENLSAMKRNLNTYNDVPVISSPVVSRKSLRLSTHRASNIRGRTGVSSCLKIT